MIKGTTLYTPLPRLSLSPSLWPLCSELLALGLRLTDLPPQELAPRPTSMP